jgi:hypothetical protein
MDVEQIPSQQTEVPMRFVLHIPLPVTSSRRGHEVRGSLLLREGWKARRVAAQINKERNAIAHQGEFRDKDEATTVIGQAIHFIETLVRIYEPGFELTHKAR